MLNGNKTPSLQILIVLSSPPTPLSPPPSPLKVLALGRVLEGGLLTYSARKGLGNQILCGDVPNGSVRQTVFQPQLQPRD